MLHLFSSPLVLIQFLSHLIHFWIQNNSAMIVLTSRNSFYPSNLNILSLLPINRKGFLDGLWLHPCLWNGSFDLLVYLRVWSTVFFRFDIWSFWSPRFAVCDFTTCHSVCLGLSWAWWLWSHSRNVVCLVLMSGKSLELDWKIYPKTLLLLLLIVRAD